MRRKKMDGMLVLSSVMFCCFLTVASGQMPACTVTQDHDLTTYTISGLPLVSGSCDYSWDNSSRHVLAHNAQEIPELVRRNSLNILVTSECFDRLIHERTYAPEGGSYTVNCTISCHETPLPQKDKVNYDYLIALAIFLVLLIVVTLCVIFRDKILRICSCSLYSAVKMQPDVEAGK